MKKMLLGFTFLLFVFNTFSQVKPDAISGEAYLLKSKKQHKTGLILLAGGVVCVATGLIIPKGDPTGEISLPYFLEEYENDGIKAVFGLTGIVSALGSIPFFIASNKNKKRATKTTISIHNKKIDYLRTNSLVARSQPSLTLKIGF